jgi:peptidoglycan/xylan/chitin deacetylase (PgdA/CDA1 family)
VSENARIEWPNGKAFAFSIIDDTDNATLENVRPAYDLLRDLGMRTTKLVWAVTGDGVPRIGGATCDDPAYRAWTLELQAAGFEIGSHGATSMTSPREVVRRSLDRFREIYGHDPRTLANHAGCLESIYWGEDRVGGLSRLT